jgi:hypothetical protein
LYILQCLKEISDDSVLKKSIRICRQTIRMQMKLNLSINLRYET